MSAPVHIFVYGTLREQSGHTMARRLRAGARLVGQGRAPGRLYDMGWYPAALFDEDETRSVLGDVFALAQGGRLLSELDAYEAGDPNYCRHALTVSLLAGGHVVAWTYGVSEPPKAPLIPGGDFISHWRAKKRRPRGS